MGITVEIDRADVEALCDLMCDNVCKGEAHGRGGKMKVRIAETLEKKGMTQRELAEVVGMTEVTISRYVNGERIPKISDALTLAKALNVEVTDLFVEDNETILENMRTRNNAKWVAEHHGGFSPGGNPLYRCSCCGWAYGTHSLFPSYRFCPECGCRMNVREDE